MPPMGPRTMALVFSFYVQGICIFMSRAPQTKKSSVDEKKKKKSPLRFS